MMRRGWLLGNILLKVQGKKGKRGREKDENCTKILLFLCYKLYISCLFLRQLAHFQDKNLIECILKNMLKSGTIRFSQIMNYH